MQIRGSFVRRRTVASTLARRSLPMSLRHWCYTERAAQTSSTTPTPVISSHNTCGQLSGLNKFRDLGPDFAKIENYTACGYRWGKPTGAD